MVQEMATAKLQLEVPTWGRRFWDWGLVLILVEVIVASTIVGVQLRRFVFDWSTPLRHIYDINRNYTFGQQAMEEGFLNVHENQILNHVEGGDRINYTPLRLGAFECWAMWNKAHLPQEADAWNPSYRFNAFMNWYHNVVEWLGAVAAFLLVRHWIIRTTPARPAETWAQLAVRGGFRATLAFLLVWFSPATLIVAHAWVSPNVLVVPFFLWALLLASWECWFLSAVVMGLGVNFQGQQLFTLAMFMFWPAFAGQFGRSLRWASGFLFTFALVVSPWMLSYPADANPQTPERTIDWPAFWWVMSAGAAVLLMNGYRLLPGRWRWIGLPIALAGAYLIVRPGLAHWSAWSWLLLAAAGIALASARWLKFRQQGYALAAVIGLCLLLCIAFYHGGTAWWELGFKYGTERHMNMAVGPANNLGALLEYRFRWNDPEMPALTLDKGLIAGWPSRDLRMTIRELLILIYAVLFITSCIAIARQWRKNDRRFLVAAVVPWLLMYSIPAQIHERYLLFPSGVGAIAIGCSFGLGAAVLFLATLGGIQTMACMGGSDRSHTIPWLGFNEREFYPAIHPGISWAVLACVAVFFVAAFIRSPWRGSDKLPLEKSPA